MSNHSANRAIEDVQNTEDTRRICIDRVGIKSIRHPILFRQRDGKKQPTVAVFDMTVNLSHEQKGTHMSRFVAILNEELAELDIQTFPQVIADMTSRLEADQGFIETRFPFFVRKKAPVTSAPSL